MIDIKKINNKNCKIAYVNRNNVHEINVRNEGNKFIGDILLKHYNTRELISKLIDKEGTTDIVELHDTVENTIYTHEYTSNTIYSPTKSYLNHEFHKIGKPVVYLFNKNKWYVVDRSQDTKYYELSKLLNNKSSDNKEQSFNQLLNIVYSLVKNSNVQELKDNNVDERNKILYMNNLSKNHIQEINKLNINKVIKLRDVNIPNQYSTHLSVREIYALGYEYNNNIIYLSYNVSKEGNVISFTLIVKLNNKIQKFVRDLNKQFSDEELKRLPNNLKSIINQSISK